MKSLNDLFLTWVGGLVVVILAAAFQKTPGYMDAEYYYAGAKLIWRGEFHREPYIWNYLSDPQGLPTPSYTYWMPLASLTAYFGMLIGRGEDFVNARIPFILLSSFIPPLTYWLGVRLSKQRFVALFAGMMAWFPMFYLAYLPTTDTFALYMILGTLWIIFADLMPKLRWDYSLFAGMICGLMHLARADGFIWMLLFGCFMVIEQFVSRKFGSKQIVFVKIVSVFLVGYALMMVGWYGRNLLEFGSLFPPGNQRALFLRTYNDLFRYPPSELNLTYLLQGGIYPILCDRMYALSQNLLSLLAVQTEIVLAPLFILGYWKRKREPIIVKSSLAWLAIFGLMSLVFPHAGWRGGYFHAAAAFQPFIWCLSGEGLGVFVEWGMKNRQWEPSQAIRVFSLFIIAFLLALTCFVYYTRVIGVRSSQESWNETLRRQSQICDSVNKIFAKEHFPNSGVMINNPVGFYLVCEHPAVSVPVGGEKSVKLVAQRFNIHYLILEKDHPPELAHYFFNPQDSSLLTLIDNSEDWKIYTIHDLP